MNYLLPDCTQKQRVEIGQKIKTPAVFVWGFKIERRHQQWKVDSRNRAMLFRRGANVFKAGVIVLRIQNHALAEKLWGTDKDGETWDFICLFENLRDVLIPASEINALLDYQANNHWQGLIVIDDDKSDMVFALFKSMVKCAPSNKAAVRTRPDPPCWRDRDPPARRTPPRYAEGLAKRPP